MAGKSLIKAEVFTPLRNNVFVIEMDSGARLTRGGVILVDDNMKDVGIRPRWSKVFSIGPEVTDLNVGEWVLVEHGKWTLGIDIEIAGEEVRMWRIDYPDSVLLVSDVDPRSAHPVKFGALNAL